MGLLVWADARESLIRRPVSHRVRQGLLQPHRKLERSLWGAVLQWSCNQYVRVSTYCLKHSFKYVTFICAQKQFALKRGSAPPFIQPTIPSGYSHTLFPFSCFVRKLESCSCDHIGCPMFTGYHWSCYRRSQESLPLSTSLSFAPLGPSSRGLF